MIGGIDHLVIATSDPDRAAAELKRRVGIAATGGGRHERFGTRNRLAFLADGSYLELIGVEDPSLLHASAPGLATGRRLAVDGDGLAAIALAVDAIDAVVAAARAGGASLLPVTDGSRRRDDGELVSWRAAFPDAPLAADGPPFLIEHDMRGAEWGPGAMAARATFAHPIGGPVGLAGVDVATDDPRLAAEAWGRATGLPVRAVADLAVVGVGRHVVRFRPLREMSTGAVVTLTADVLEPRSVDAVGVRWAIEPGSARSEPRTDGAPTASPRG